MDTLVKSGKTIEQHIEMIKTVFKPTMHDLSDILGASRASINNWIKTNKVHDRSKEAIILALSQAADAQQERK